MPYDPIADEKKEFSLAEFVAVAKEELDKYEKEWKDTNTYHKKPHTWNEWWGTFHRYMSW